MVQTKFGPRRLVLQTARKATSQKKLRGTLDSTVEPGNVNLYSYANPGLKSDQTYTANFVQKISYPGKDPERNLISTKQFQTTGTPYALDPSVVNSVYPPAGHADYWNVLPHIVFNNPQTPWTFQGASVQASEDPVPWLALLVFTEDELSPYLNQLDSYGIPSLQRTPTFAYNVKIKDLVNAKSLSQPIPSTSDTQSDESQVQVIFLQQGLFNGLFGLYDKPNTATPNAANKTPDLQRYKFMSHVRQFDTSGLANRDASSATELAVTISPRTGPINTPQPQITYAHLVSVAGITTNSNMQLNGGRPSALISLYSWSFTYLPPMSFAAKAVLANLGTTLQPLRLPDTTLAAVKTKNQSESQADSWVKLKMLAGYTIMNYRAPTGEQMLALNRSILSPVKGDAMDFPPSSYGSDLAVVDEKSGLLDLTYQLAWELGRTMAIGDRTFSAAVMRLRRTIHNQTLEDAKKKLNAEFSPIPNVISDNSQLQANLVKRQQQQVRFAPNRWGLAPLGTSTKELLSFQNPAVHRQYQFQLQDGIGGLALAVPDPPPLNQALRAAPPIDYDEHNDPESSDYATILSWIMDKWYLQGIPFANLLPDPGYLPKESVRSFYVDGNWFKVFVDGVLSISEHFDEGDDVREAIKKSLTDFLAADVAETGCPPQVPRWGLMIRSEFVTKFPDLRVHAPFTDDSKTGKQSEVLRAERLDKDLLLLLFDREPGDFDTEDGITISPPEHQLSCMFGSEEGVNTTSRKIEFYWKPVSIVPGPQSSQKPTADSFLLEDPANAVYDPSCRALCPAVFAQKALKFQGNMADSYGKSALVGSQLIATVPSMKLLPPSPTGLLQVVGHKTPILTTNKGELEQQVTPPTGPIIKPPSVQPTIYVPLTTYPVPRSDMVRAIAKLDVYDSADTMVVNKFFRLAQTSPPQQGPPNPGSGQASNTRTGGSLSFSCISTSVMNVRYQKTQTALVSFFPISLGLKTDITILISSLIDSPRLLTSLSIDISVGPHTGGSFPSYLLAPFPVNRASQPVRNSAGEWPLQPNHSGPKFNGVVLPRVRTIGQSSQRWNTRTSFSGNTFNITLIPNCRSSNPAGSVPPYWDINTYRDLGIVIENVQVNCLDGMQIVPPPGWQGRGMFYYNGPGCSTSNFRLNMTENYWDSTQARQVNAVGYADVNVYGVDPSYQAITPPYMGPRTSIPVSFR